LGASNGFDQQSMIALALSRILELGATVMEEWPTILELSNVVRVTPPGAEPYPTEGHNRQSTQADRPPCDISGAPRS
jgi:hypothetical protein